MKTLLHLLLTSMLLVMMAVAVQGAEMGSLQLRGPATVEQGVPYDTEIVFTPQGDLKDVAIQVLLPSGVEYVKSTPEGKRNGTVLEWREAALKKCQAQRYTVTVKATGNGPIELCAQAIATAQLCYKSAVIKAAIAIRKSGPAEALLNSVVPYTIEVSNPGSAPARDVVVTDIVPEGMTHESGKTTLSYPLGTLEPGATRTLYVLLTAAKRGTFVNKARVETSNAGNAEATAPTVVVLRDYTLEKTGTAEQFVNKKATYTITLRNTGDVALKNISVQDQAPGETRILAAEGAKVYGNAATWVVEQLNPNESKQFTLTLTSAILGTHRNRVASITPDGLQRTAAADTLWKGMPALLIEVVDTEDPLTKDEMTTYDIRVTNQGTERDHNVQIVAELPEQLEIVTVGGATEGTVAGRTVTFAPFPVLQPKQQLMFSVRAKAVAEGDARVKVKLTSDLLKTPVVEEESTHVY